jgi:DNA polymerase III epsilon subunit-like protein
MSPKPLYLKPRGAVELVPWEEIAVDAPEVGPLTRLDQAQFVALDVETTGNDPFLVLELGAERFTLDTTLSFFDTLVDCRAPINPYAKKRHHIDRSMLIGAPEFRDARRAFLRFAQGAVLVEHSHDAFDTWLVGRGLESPLEHPIIDTSALGRLVLDLPKGLTPGRWYFAPSWLARRRAWAGRRWATCWRLCRARSSTGRRLVEER